MLAVNKVGGTDRSPAQLVRLAASASTILANAGLARATAQRGRICGPDLLLGEVGHVSFSFVP